MGADGTWSLLPAQQFVAQWPDIKPEDCDLGTATVLGVECVTAYSDTDGRGEWVGSPIDKAESVERLRNDLARAEREGGKFERPNFWSSTPSVITAQGCREALDSYARDNDLDWLARVLEARRWFDAHAEHHTVWT